MLFVRHLHKSVWMKGGRDKREVGEERITVGVHPTTSASNKHRTHPNVYQMYYFRLFNGIAYAARSAAIFDAYLHLKFGNNRTVGLVTSFNGLASLVVAPVSGLVADSFSSYRAVLLRWSAVLAALCIWLNYLAVCTDNIHIILMSSFLWRCWYEFVFIITESLFVDSIPIGHRSELFVYRRVVTTLANGLGPLLSLILFGYVGNQWSLSILQPVLQVATLFSIPQLLTLLFWRDVPPASPSSPISSYSSMAYSSTLSASETLPLLSQPPVFPNPSPSTPPSSYPCASSLLPPPTTAVSSSSSYCHPPISSPRITLWGPIKLGRSAVPWIVFSSHVITFAGAGMTVKYFPLFFKQEYAFKPVHTCLLSSVYTLFIAAFTYAISATARRLGRVQASLFFTMAGIIRVLVDVCCAICPEVYSQCVASRGFHWFSAFTSSGVVCKTLQRRSIVLSLWILSIRDILVSGQPYNHWLLSLGRHPPYLVAFWRI
eukprot:GHVS01084083.1.p1 GENE.GHVS01084083.1~~GHVS01084083.1.p1  ORF type:complete len:488 (-),score=37.80 GHVS01084083.1:603-2066(-)